MNGFLRPDRPFQPWQLAVVAIIVVGGIGCSFWLVALIVWGRS